MKVSEVITQIIAIVDEEIAVDGTELSAAEVAVILGTIEKAVPYIRALEARVEAISAEQLRQCGPNIIPLAEYRRVRGVGPTTNGGVA